MSPHTEEQESASRIGRYPDQRPWRSRDYCCNSCGARVFGNEIPCPGLEKLARACGLSRREREVLWLVGQSQKNMAIAGQLGISLSTMKMHLRHLQGKTGTSDKQDIMKLARECCSCHLKGLDRKKTGKPILMYRLSDRSDLSRIPPVRIGIRRKRRASRKWRARRRNRKPAHGGGGGI